MLTYATTDILTTKTENRKFDIYNYGEDNAYPNNNDILALNSGALLSVWTTYLDFIYGKGMETAGDFWKMKVNIYGLRVDQLLRRIQTDYSKHRGFAVKVVYNGLLEKVGLVPVPFETLRLATADDFGRIVKIRYCKDWTASRINSSDIITYDVYNPDKNAILRQIEAAGGIEKWSGQIFYYGNDGLVEYPHCKFHAVIEDVLTDISIKKGRNANTSTNFMASHLLQVPYTFESLVDESITDTDERRKAAATLRTAFVESLNNFQGNENMGKLLLLENDKTDNDGNMVPLQLDKFDIQNYDKLFESTESSAFNSIRRNYKLPAILLDPVATGFSTEIMQSFYNYYNQITSLDRQIFEESIMDLFTGFKNLPADASYQIQPLSYI